MTPEGQAWLFVFIVCVVTGIIIFSIEDDQMPTTRHEVTYIVQKFHKGSWIDIEEPYASLNAAKRMYLTQKDLHPDQDFRVIKDFYTREVIEFEDQ